MDEYYELWIFFYGCPDNVVIQMRTYILDQALVMSYISLLWWNGGSWNFLSAGDPDSPIDLSRPDAVLVSSDPKQDHNYSSSSFQRCSSRSSSSSLSSLDETACDSNQGRRAGSEGFHSDEDSEEERSSRPPSLPVRHPLKVKCPVPVKRARRESKPELDEELKEAAGSLLHLAGIRPGLDLSKRGAKSKKLEKHWK